MMSGDASLHGADLRLSVRTGPGPGLDWGHFNPASARTGARIQQPRKVSHATEKHNCHTASSRARRGTPMKRDWVVTPRDADGCGIFTSERHRYASRLSEGHRRVVEIATVDRNTFGVEKLNLGVAPDAARRANIGDTDCHRARTCESLCVAGEDHQLVAGARRS